RENITVLHCNSAYPTPFEDVNLRAMVTLRDRLNIKVGYSDHTMGIEVAIAAAAMGAVVIEKHITLDRNMEGPDHKASLEPPKFKTLVDAIRIIEKSIGDGVKKPTSSELKNIHVIRKSIVAATAINKWTILTNKKITTKRLTLG
ncbi:MAG: N-acetylneuraminate synthase family protein, partial [Planctomycetes bacterium]|nr:N-acetylneuraminate synthase family protein [Planctomycetota bacterium]